MKLRKIASLFVVLGLAVGLLGAGVSASFTDSATATTTIHVGTFNIDVSTTVTGCTVVDGTSVSCNLADIQGSAPGTRPFPFTITNTGSIPANIAVSVSAMGGHFSDMLGPVAPFVLAPAAHHDFAGGIQWVELTSGDLNQTVTIVYTIAATA